MIGTDIVDKRRIARLWEQKGWHFAKKVLHPDELVRLHAQKNPIRFLAMRWAGKEAFSKALGTGLRAPVLMPSFAIQNNAQGTPFFQLSPQIEEILKIQGITNIHLSLSDEQHYALATVMLTVH